MPKISTTDSLLDNLARHKFNLNMNPITLKVDFKYQLPQRQKYYFAVFNYDDMPDFYRVVKNEYPFNTNYKDMQYFATGNARYRGINHPQDVNFDTPAYLIYFVRKQNKTIGWDYQEIWP